LSKVAYPCSRCSMYRTARFLLAPLELAIPTLVAFIALRWMEIPL